MSNENSTSKIELVLNQKENTDDGIDFGELFGICWKKRWAFILFCIIAFAMAMIVLLIAGLFSESSGTASSIINFNYDGIEDGVDPYGNSFDPNMIKSAEVLNKVITECELEITVELLRQNVNIQGIVPDYAIERILLINKMSEKDPSKLESLKDISYFPVQYKVDLVLNKKLKINSKDATKIIDSIINNFRDVFMEKYSDKNILNTAITIVDYIKYDYPEFSLVIDDQIKIINNYLNGKMLERGEFRSKETQMSFGDILSLSTLLKSVDLNRYEAIVFKYNITNDEVKLKSLYENRIINLNMEMNKKMAEANAAKAVAASYIRESSVIMGGSTGEAMEFNKNSSTYDDIVAQSLSAEVAAAEHRENINYYTERIKGINPTPVVDANGNVIPQANVLSPEQLTSYKETLNKDRASIIAQISNIVEITNKTVNEYYETVVFSDAIKIAVPGVYYSPIMENLKKNLIYSAIIAVITVFVYFIIVLFTFLKKKKK